MFSFIAIVALVTGTSGKVVPSLNMPSLDKALRISAPTEGKASRIINGETAGDGEFPHQLSLLYENSNRYYHTCGAALLSANWAITAAHCVDGRNRDRFFVAGGFTDLSNPGPVYFFSGISEIIMHEYYNIGVGAFPNDIALLRISQPDYAFAEYAKINLADNWFDPSRVDCYISGWGVTAKCFHRSCIKWSAGWKKECSSIWESSNILLQHICVWGLDHPDGSGSCNGDSGGPLTCNGVLAGLTSWGRTGCHNNGEVEYPSVYVRVSEFRDWIESRCFDCNFVSL